MIDLATTEKRTLRIDETAEALGVSRRTVYNWIDRGLLLVVPMNGEGWRIDTDSVRAQAARRTPPGLLVVVQVVHGNPA